MKVFLRFDGDEIVFTSQPSNATAWVYTSESFVVMHEDEGAILREERLYFEVEAGNNATA